MKTVGVFADVGNLFYCISKKYDGKKLNYQRYLQRAVNGNRLYRAFAYGVQIENEATPFINCLKHYGYEPIYKKSHDNKRVNWSVGLSMDVVRCIERLDIVVLGTADPSLSHLISWVKEKGVECRILACGIPKDLKEVSNFYTEIADDLLETKEKEKEEKEKEEKEKGDNEVSDTEE